MLINQLAQLDNKAVTSENICDYGWYDWWSTDNAIARLTPKFVTLAKRLAPKFGECKFFLKQNCPLGDRNYESFVIQNKEQDNVYWIDNSDHPHQWQVIKVNQTGQHNTLAKDLGTREMAAFVNTLDLPE